MRRLLGRVLFVTAVCGFVLTFSTREESRKEQRVGGTSGVVGEDGVVHWYEGHEVYSVGLPGSPWYKSRMDASSICGVGQTKLTLLSWSSVVFGLSIACLWGSRRLSRVIAAGPPA